MENEDIIIIKEGEEKEKETIILNNQDNSNKYKNLTLRQLFNKWIKHYFYRNEDDPIFAIDDNNQTILNQIYDIKINKKLAFQLFFVLLTAILTFGIVSYIITVRVIEINSPLTEITNKFDTPLYENTLFENSEEIIGWTESDRKQHNWCNVTILPPFPIKHYKNTTNISTTELKTIIKGLRSSLTQLEIQNGKEEEKGKEKEVELLCVTQAIMSNEPLNILVFRNGYVFTDIYKIISPKDYPSQYYQLYFPCKEQNINLIAVTSSNITIFHSLGQTTILDEQYSRCVQHYYQLN